MPLTGQVRSAGGSVGTLLSAVAATCCLFPITLAALGVSTSMLGAYTEFIEQWELYAFVVAFAFLGVGFFTAYRNGGGGRVQKAILWVSFALVLIATVYEGYENLLAGEEEVALRLLAGPLV